MLHIYAALAEKERRNISIRTKQALAVAKARGVRLGNAEQAQENKREADKYAKTLPILIELRRLPVEKIADELTSRRSPRGAARRSLAWQDGGKPARSAALAMIVSAH
jgi:DNA invertase Pin-like site-specific DNA recombinase